MAAVNTPPTVTRNSRGFLLGSFVAAIVVWAGAFVAGAASSASAAPEGTPNACGCYSDSTGSCYCGKKTKCGCPGECEPKGCEEKRQKQLEKEIAEETKKATAGKAAGKATKSQEKEGAGDGGDAAAAKKKAKPMSAGQKKELAKLLDAYLAEHPEGRSQTIAEVRGVLGE
jgi:hypothetical protein